MRWMTLRSSFQTHLGNSNQESRDSRGVVFDLMAGAVHFLHAWSSARLRQLRSVTPDQWLLIGFTLLMLAFLLALIFEPGSVGRGGR